MAALVPLGGPRSRLRHHSRISATSHTGERMDCCIAVAKGRPFNHNQTGTKRKRSSAPRQKNPELPEEIIVMEILVRLPVKSLVRLKSICKAWRATISDPSFIRAQLQWSTSKWEQDPCFIISPHTMDYYLPGGDLRPTISSNHICFYQWRQQQVATSSNNSNQMATFVHDKHFSRLFDSVHYLMHCDGLVLVATDTRLFVFNPATRDAVELPGSLRNTMQRGGGEDCCYCACIGHDPRTAKYKVVQAFIRPEFFWYDNPTAFMGANGYLQSMGMEVFTIAGGDNGCMGWKQIADDLPYPADMAQAGRCVGGFMFWFLANHIEHHQPRPRPRGLLHLSLADEKFGITGLPDSLESSPDDALALDVMRGRELCLTAWTKDESMLNIWSLSVVGEGGLMTTKLPPLWERRLSIRISGFYRPTDLPPCSSRFMLRLDEDHSICLYDLKSSKLTPVCNLARIRYQGRKGRKWKHLINFHVMPFTESVIPIRSPTARQMLFP